MRVLVTGALGWTAKAIIEALVTEQYQVSGLDLPLATSHANTELFAHIHRGTVSDYDFVLKATKDTDVIVHLAVATGGGYNTPTIPFDVNVRGTANIFQSAIQNNIQRVVLMSSAPFHVNHNGKIHAINDRLQGQSGDFMYDMTKCLQEDIARYYAQTLGTKVVTLRAGHIVDGRTNLDPKGRALETITYGRGAWICRYDLARAVVLALSHPVENYDAFHIIGAKDAKNYFDMERTETILGFIPETKFEQYPPNKKGEA